MRTDVYVYGMKVEGVYPLPPSYTPGMPASTRTLPSHRPSCAQTTGQMVRYFWVFLAGTGMHCIALRPQRPFDQYADRALDRL